MDEKAFQEYVNEFGETRMKITDEHFKINDELVEKIDNLKPLENFDKIEFVSPNEVQNLLDWRDNNKDLVRKHNFPLEKGVIDSVFNGIKIIFHKFGDSIYLDLLMKRNGKFQHFLIFVLFHKKMQIRLLHPKKEIIEKNGEFYDEQVHSVITVFASLMAYMEHYKENKELVSKKTIQSVKTKKKKNGKKKTIRKASKVIYNISVNKESNENTEKREYHLDENKSWNVRGHSRTLKNGKTIWIKPYVKGNKEEKPQPATYRL